MTRQSIIDTVADYYTGKIEEFGTTSKGVDWSTEESQLLRFEQLSRVITRHNDFSIADVGCGYGAYLSYLLKHYADFQYAGYDVSAKMVEAAQAAYQNIDAARFICSSGEDAETVDYAIASGIFNVKLDCTDPKWLEYIYTMLHQLDACTSQGFSFNCLTKYSDKEHMKDYLYYADPSLIFDYCKRNFSRNVALLHDYKLYEFTIIVRKEYD